MHDEPIGRRLRALREQAGISQTDMARILGVTHPTISRTETGATPPSLETVEAWARACGRRVRIEFPPEGDAAMVEHWVSVFEELGASDQSREFREDLLAIAHAFVQLSRSRKPLVVNELIALVEAAQTEAERLFDSRKIAEDAAYYENRRARLLEQIAMQEEFRDEMMAKRPDRAEHIAYGSNRLIRRLRDELEEVESVRAGDEVALSPHRAAAAALAAQVRAEWIETIDKNRYFK